ncbi:hypothetical protein FOZ61_008522 [Perkinsus olseni]|nr:hypothetical protein FOZ61_008522 [Perkinsus olseni]
MLSDGREGISGIPQCSSYTVDRTRVRSNSTASRLGLGEPSVSTRRHYGSCSTASRLGRSPDEVMSWSSSDSLRARVPLISAKVGIICDDVVAFDSLLQTVCLGCKASSMFDDSVLICSPPFLSSPSSIGSFGDNSADDEHLKVAQLPPEACSITDLTTVAKKSDILVGQILAVSSRLYEHVLLALVGKIKQASDRPPSLCLYLRPGQYIPIDEDGFVSLSDLAMTTLKPSGLASASVMFNLGTAKPRFVIGSHDASQGELLAALVESADAAADAWVIEQPNAVEAIFSLGPLIKAAISSASADSSEPREFTVVREVQALLGRYMRYNKEPSCCRLIPQIVHYLATEPDDEHSANDLSTLCLSRDFLTFVQYRNLADKVPQLSRVAVDLLDDKCGLAFVVGRGGMSPPAARAGDFNEAVGRHFAIPAN